MFRKFSTLYPVWLFSVNSLTDLTPPPKHRNSGVKTEYDAKSRGRSLQQKQKKFKKIIAEPLHRGIIIK